MQALALLALLLIALLVGGMLLAIRLGAARARERAAAKETQSAQQRADDAVAAQEVRREVDRSSFGDAVDRL